MEASDIIKPFEDHRCKYAGPAGPSSLRHMVEYVSEMIRAGVTSETLPESGIIGKLADRICGPTTKDCIVQMEGKKGSGKSTIAIELAYQLSRALAKRKGGKPEDFFNLTNVIVLSDAKTIFETLQRIPKYSVLILDDLGIGANSRESQTKDNISMGNILAISRTKCWTIITTSPLRSQVDKNVRLFCDVIVRTYSQIPRVDDKPGFNIVKMHLVKLNPITQREITPNFIDRDADYNKRKVTLYAVFYPPKHLIDPYNQSREDATNEVIKRIIENGSFNKRPKAEKVDKVGEYMSKLTPELIDQVKCGMSARSLAIKLKCGQMMAGHVKERIDNGEV